MKTPASFLLALILSAHGALALAGPKSPREGDAPPELQLGAMIQGPSNEELSWDALKGRVVVLEFWNTRCAPCVQGIPHWNELVEEFSSKPVVFLAVSDDNEDSLKRFLRRTPMKGWLVLDRPLNPTRAAFDVIGIPHTVIVNAEGKIAAITHPRLLEAHHLEEMLAGKARSLPAFEPYVEKERDPSLSALITSIPPASAHVAIEGPFPTPTSGAFNSRGWTVEGFHFDARLAFLRDTLASFFKISPGLILEETTLPEGLYNLSAAAPPEGLDDLPNELQLAINARLGIHVQMENREIRVYSMTVSNSDAPGFKATTRMGGGGGKPGGFSSDGSPIATVGAFLEERLDYPVIDDTGLSGLWEADIRWEMSAEELDGGPADPARVIKASREQLGLKLELVTRELPVLVVREAPSASQQ